MDKNCLIYVFFPFHLGDKFYVMGQIRSSTFRLGGGETPTFSKNFGRGAFGAQKCPFLALVCEHSGGKSRLRPPLKRDSWSGPQGRIQRGDGEQPHHQWPLTIKSVPKSIRRRFQRRIPGRAWEKEHIPPMPSQGGKIGFPSPISAKCLIKMANFRCTIGPAGKFFRKIPLFSEICPQ